MIIKANMQRVVIIQKRTICLNLAVFNHSVFNTKKQCCSIKHISNYIFDLASLIKAQMSGNNTTAKMTETEKFMETFGLNIICQTYVIGKNMKCVKVAIFSVAIFLYKIAVVFKQI